MKNLIKSLMRTYTRSKFEPVVKKYQTCLIRQISFKFQFDQILFKFFAPHVQISSGVYIPSKFWKLSPLPSLPHLKSFPTLHDFYIVKYSVRILSLPVWNFLLKRFPHPPAGLRGGGISDGIYIPDRESLQYCARISRSKSDHTSVQVINKHSDFHTEIWK